MKKVYYSIFIALMSFTSCQKKLLPTVSNNTPVNNFDAMWNGYQQWYGLFITKQINWDSLYAANRPKVNNEMSGVELYEVLCDLIKPLNDPHVFLQPTSLSLPRYESSVFFRDNKIQLDFSIDLIKENYLPSLITIDDKFHYGKLPGNIGYIHFGEFGMPLSFYENQLKKVMGNLKQTKAMIIDIRNHGGGDDEVSRYIAGYFAIEKKGFMTVKKRNGPDKDNFSYPVAWYVQPEPDAYTHPIILLTSRWTTSAGETFTWAMNTQANIKQVGDTTAGGFSDLLPRELPNGWLYFISVGDYRDANGNNMEGKGIAPKKRVINTKENIHSQKDIVLEEAIKMLQ